MSCLGAFELQALLARGGMGAVWRGRHAQTHLPVAVKVLRADRERREWLADLIDREAQALAMLDHARIVRLIDWGRVGPEEAGDGLDPGSPYLVLEFVSGGDLSPHGGTLGWTDLRRVLLGVLDGLAHAHAHGVIHLDIKPANVLLVGGLDTMLEPRLTDFGIARRIDQARSEDPLVAGTPGFMAPEMASGGRLGPWTDLFAVGGLAEFLVDRDATVPLGLEGWLDRMLAERPEERFRHAAHAAHALRAIGGAGHRLGPATGRLAAETWVLDEPAEVALSETGLPERPAVDVAIEVPPDWRPLPSTLPGQRFPDAGLGLLAFRRPPLFGRSDEQDALWEAFAGVVEGSRIAHVHGPRGAGVSSLAGWLVLRVRELGLGPALSVLVSDGDTLAAALRRALRPAPWVGDPGDSLASWVQSDDPEIPIGLLHQALAAASWERPVVLWVDEAQLLGDQLEALGPLFRSPALRVFGVFTTPEADGERWTERIGELGPDVRSIALGPQDPEEIVAMLALTSMIQPGPARRIADAVDGRPGLAHQLLLELQAAGRLRVGRDGLELDDRPIHVEGMGEMALGRIERALSVLSLSSRVAVERAATLGQSVDGPLWEAVGVPLPTMGERNRLVAEGVLAPTEDGVRFRSTGVRTIVCDLARERGRTGSNHSAVARALEERERLGEAGLHWAEAGDVGRAWRALAAGIQGAFSMRRAPMLRGWIGALDRLCTQADWPEGDPRRGEPELLRAQHLMTLSRLEEAILAAERVALDARGRRWPGVEARARWIQGRVASYLGDPTRAETLLQEAHALAVEVGDELTAGRCLVDIGRCANEVGELDRARARILEGLPLVIRHAPGAGVLGCQLMADIESRRGALDEAERWCARAEELHLDQAEQRDVSHVVLRAGILQARGDLDGAEELYRQLIRRVDPTVVTDSAIALMNLAVLLQEREAWTEATSALERAAASYRIARRAGMEAICHALLLEPLSALADRRAFVRHLGAAERLIPRTGYSHEEVHRRLGNAARRAEAAGWAEAARVRALQGSQRLPVHSPG